MIIGLFFVLTFNRITRVYCGSASLVQSELLLYKLLYLQPHSLSYTEKEVDYVRMAVKNIMLAGGFLNMNSGLENIHI